MSTMKVENVKMNEKYYAVNFKKSMSHLFRAHGANQTL